MRGIDRIVKIVEEVFGRGLRTNDPVIRKHHCLFILEPVIHRHIIRDLADAIDANDKAKMKEILDFGQMIIDFGLNSPHCPPHYAKYVIIMRRLRAELLGEAMFDIDPNSPNADLMGRLAGHMGQRRWRNVDSMDEVEFPGDRIPKSSVNIGPYDPADDVMFVTDDPNTDWIAELISDNHEVVVALHEYHKTDVDKTQARLDEYVAAGFGPGMRPKVIFYPRGEYYVCLGLAYLVPTVFNPHRFPKILWVFPQLNKE